MEPLDGVRLTAEVGRVIGERVGLMGATARGESRSTYFLKGQSGEMVLKVSPAGTAALADQERLMRLVNGLRARGYPAPEYLGAGRVDEVVFTVQRRLPGQTLEPGPGMACYRVAARCRGPARPAVAGLAHRHGRARRRGLLPPRDDAPK